MIEFPLLFRLRTCIVMKREMDEEVAVILSTVRMCQALQVLPKAGGLLDQDSYFVYLLSHVMEYDHEKAELDASRQRLGSRS